MRVYVYIQIYIIEMVLALYQQGISGYWICFWENVYIFFEMAHPDLFSATRMDPQMPHKDSKQHLQLFI